MKLFPPAAAIGLLLCHCAPGPGSGERTLRGYPLGLEKGSADRAAGLPNLPHRYESEYSASERAAFFRGYEKGYRSGGR